MMEVLIYESQTFDPHVNLAVEEYLLSRADNAVILYLWQNENTVVIGKNQNPWKECRTTLLEEEGGHLARRLSGGGAVFHDRGNLNFTFLMPQSQFDLTKQFCVIMDAVAGFGVPVRFSGRNDIVAEGGKFSGNAFYRNGKQAYHHGTLLVDADMEKLSRYLSPSKAKLQAKGVDSVRSRVVNLNALCVDITVDSLKSALKESFSRNYGPASPLEIEDWTPVEQLTRRYRSWEWNYGQKLPFSFEYEERFPWGGIQLALRVENGIIRQLKVYSDAMDWQVAPVLEQVLTGCRFTKAAVGERIARTGMETAEDICRMISESEI